MSKKQTRLTGEIFDALPEAEKRRIRRELEQMTPEQIKAEFRPLAAKEKRELYQPPRKAGRPKLGKGTEIISVTVEKSLLKQANAYAKANGMKRSELVTIGIKAVLEHQLKTGAQAGEIAKAG